MVSPDGALFAEFADPDAARRAYAELSARGYERLQSYAPSPLPRDQAHPRDDWPALVIPMFALGTIGGVAGYAVQWYANARSYALNIGGRPAHAALPFILPSLEALLLFAGLTAFAGLLIALRLPRLWRPVFEIDGFERASIDRYWVAVGLGSGGGDLARTTRELVSMQPLRILHVAAEP